MYRHKDDKTWVVRYADKKKVREKKFLIDGDDERTKEVTRNFAFKMKEKDEDELIIWDPLGYRE
jgi:hypothetical protein